MNIINRIDLFLIEGMKKKRKAYETLYNTIMAARNEEQLQLAQQMLDGYITEFYGEGGVDPDKWEEQGPPPDLVNLFGAMQRREDAIMNIQSNK